MKLILLACAVLAAIPLASAEAQPSDATQPNDIGTITVFGAPPPGTAADIAPSRGPLEADQPTSVVGNTFIRENITPTNNYDRVILFTPSVQNVEPTGAGLQQNYQESIRGFQYTQFNTTLDGLVLPGLTLNFAPQSSLYVKAHAIDSVEVDRGPGTASTIGYATFGGTVGIRTRTPSDAFGADLYGTYGSFDTRLYGGRIDSGAVGDLDGARGYVDVQRLEALGSQTGNATVQDNLVAKAEIPVDDDTLVTLFGLYNHQYVHTAYGATPAQIATIGPDYALTADPRSQSYVGYNWNSYATDFNYVDVKRDFGDGWRGQATIYTNGYFQKDQTGQDPNGTTPNLTGDYVSNGQPIALANDVPGFRDHIDFRDSGIVIRLAKDTDIGQLRGGFWYDYSNSSFFRYQIVLDNGAIPYQSPTQATPFVYNLHTDLRTVQTYLEWALTPIENFKITPGIRFNATTRDLDARLNFNGQPARFEQTYSAVQPSVDARYTLREGWTAYAQVARGFLAPGINVLVTSKPTPVNPETTWNYQVGSNVQRDWLSLSGDLYYIQFGNLITSRPDPVYGAVYYNAGGAIYKGAELEGTARVADGVSLYGNYSLLRSNQVSGPYKGQTLAFTPRNTAAAGVLLHRDDVWLDTDRLYGSVIGKWVGPQYLFDTPTYFPIKAYFTADLALGYRFPIGDGRTLDAKLNVNNLGDNRSAAGYNDITGDGVTPSLFTNPKRSYFLTLEAAL